MIPAFDGSRIPGISLGFSDVQVEMETDTLFTVIGRVDPDRRRNWETQFRAARDHDVKLIGFASVADQLIERVLAYFDDPTTYSSRC